MRRSVVVLSLALCFVPAPAVESESALEKVLALCEQVGGCILIPLVKFEALKRAAQCGFKEA